MIREWLWMAWRMVWLLYEIGCSQGEDVADLLRKEGYEDIEIRQDLCGLDRVVLGRKKLQEEKYV